MASTAKLSLLSLLAFLLSSWCRNIDVVRAQILDSAKTILPAGSTLPQEMDLEAMSDAELEEVCTNRGFELARETDEATGEAFVYTHEEYMDAARQCLEIEAEMERILRENPDVLEELQAETARMMQEKRALEMMDAQKKFLDKERVQKGSTAFTKDDLEKPGGDYGRDTAAAIPVAGETGIESREEQGNADEANVLHNNSTHSQLPDDSDSLLDLDRATEGATVSATGSSEETRGSKTPTNGSFSAVDDRDTPVHEGTPKTLATGNSGNRLFTVQEVIFEFREKVYRDFERISDIILPKPMRGPLMSAIRPMVRIAKNTGMGAIDMLKRYLVLLLDASKKAQDNRSTKKKEEAARSTKKPAFP